MSELDEKALDAARTALQTYPYTGRFDYHGQAVAAIRAYLAALPTGEAVAWRYRTPGGKHWSFTHAPWPGDTWGENWERQPLFAAPAPMSRETTSRDTPLSDLVAGITDDNRHGEVGPSRDDVLEELQNQSTVEAQAALAKAREALEQAEACMSIVEPRSDKAEYLRILSVIRAALAPEGK